MTRYFWPNVVGVTAVLTVAALASFAVREPSPSPRVDSKSHHSARDLTPIEDASGHRVAPRRFQRIVSASILTDRILLELCEPSRLLGFSRYGALHSSFRHQLGDKAVVDGLNGIEQLLTLRPDLVLINSLGDPRRVARIREAGVEVFDLGEMRGLDSFLKQVELVAILIDSHERGREVARRFSQRMHHIAADILPRQRPRALFLVSLGHELYGGAVGTSYHDVLTFAGLEDVAASRYRDWPHYNVEDLLSLRPDLLVTKTGYAQMLCARAGLSNLAACKNQGAIIELPPELIDEPGMTMLEATEALHQRVFHREPDRPPHGAASPRVLLTNQERE